MKKTALALAAILIGIYCALSILGWGDEYTAERIFYRAMIANRKIEINPDVAPPEILSAVEIDLLTIIKKYPESSIKKTAYVRLAEFYLANKKYDKALAVINDILNTYKKDPFVLSHAHFLKGTYYEKRNNRAGARREYLETIKIFNGVKERTKDARLKKLLQEKINTLTSLAKNATVGGRNRQ